MANTTKVWLNRGVTAAIIALLGGGLVAGIYLTNPFSRFSLIRRPFVVTLTKETFEAVNNNHRLRVRQGLLWRWFAIIKSGAYILTTRYLHSPRAAGTTVEAIIAGIHRLRFDPSKLLLISGDHFNGLFVRNLGVFYYPMLDTCVLSSKQDWENRQAVYLQTVAYALGVYAKYPIPTTTIYSTGALRATCVNFYAYPSDTGYGIVYALAALLGKEPGRPYAYTETHLKLHTQLAAKLLIHEYRTTLQTLYSHYRSTAFDEITGLVRIDLHMSGAKDITRRQSSFYDNVIFWKTTQLAQMLGLIPSDQTFLDELKRRILKTFWLEKPGYFLEDLSPESQHHTYYSSDWLIVLATGFLQIDNPTERHYFERSVRYIQAQGIDQPFALKYHADTRAHRQFLAVRLAVASYGGDAIWSFWGMEYIKVLLMLHRQTGRNAYLETADHHIATYEQAMLRDGGFPEVYDAKGRMLQTLLYRSIRQTGWVIGFEQVRAMRAAQAHQDTRSLD